MLLLRLACGVACVAGSLLLSLQLSFCSLFLGLKAARFRSRLGCLFSFAGELFNPGCLTLLLGFGTRGGLRLPLGSLFQHSRIVRPRLGLELFDDVLPGVLRGGLPVRKTRLLKTHTVDVFLFNGVLGGL